MIKSFQPIILILFLKLRFIVVIYTLIFYLIQIDFAYVTSDTPVAFMSLK